MAKILVVDDNPGLRSMLRILLNTNGHETLLAEDGQEALELIKQYKFDLMITDLRMPHMNGMSLLRAVNALELAKPVILITAYTSRETADEAVRLGAFAYLAKPFNIDEMMAAIGCALEAAKNKAQAPGLPGGNG